MSVRRVDNGGIVVNCHCGCSSQDIVDAMGLKMSDLMPEREDNTRQTDGRWKHIADYPYHDADGKIVYRKRRWLKPDGGKSFTFEHPDGKGGWVKGKGPAGHVPYMLPGLIEAKIVFLVEGEKDVDTLMANGIAATTSPLGAQDNKWPAHFTDWFRGKVVYIIPDNDEPGKRFAITEANAVKTVAASLKLLDLTKVYPELPMKGDVTDLREAVGADKRLELLAELVGNTPEWDPFAPFALLRHPIYQKIKFSRLRNFRTPYATSRRQ